MAWKNRVPTLGNRVAFENEGQAYSDHVADGDKEHSENGDAESSVWIDAEVKDQDSYLSQGGCWDIDDHRGRSPLFVW